MLTITPETRRQDALLAAQIRADLEAIADRPQPAYRLMCVLWKGRDQDYQEKTAIVEAISDRFIDVIDAINLQHPGWRFHESLF